MSKHTENPAHYVDKARDILVPLANALVLCGHRTIASQVSDADQLLFDFLCTKRKEESNAKLFDSAPEMLAELKEIVSFARIEKCALREQEIKSIEAVIAKAEGK